MSFDIPWLTKLQKNSRYGKLSGEEISIFTYGDNSLYIMEVGSGDSKQIYRTRLPRHRQAYVANRILRLEYDDSGKPKLRVLKCRSGMTDQYLDISEQEIFWLLLQAKDARECEIR